jgi:predicted metal-dependent phosphoesterase TrpH
VRSAAAVGLSAVAVTDHDTLTGIASARDEATRLGVELIPGIELTAEREGREVHLLGHFVRDDDPDLLAATIALREARARRIEAMVDSLASHGYSIDLAALRRLFPRATIGRKHLAEWLARTGQVSFLRAAFSELLADHGPIQVPKPRIPWRTAIELIHGAGGTAGLAHPPRDLRQSDLAEYRSAGLDAVEVAGPRVPRSVRLRRELWAETFDLVLIAGSDFHAPDRPGRWVGSVTTPREQVMRLRERVRSTSIAPSAD